MSWLIVEVQSANYTGSNLGKFLPLCVPWFSCLKISIIIYPPCRSLYED